MIPCSPVAFLEFSDPEFAASAKQQAQGMKFGIADKLISMSLNQSSSPFTTVIIPSPWHLVSCGLVRSLNVIHVLLTRYSRSIRPQAWKQAQQEIFGHQSKHQPRRYVFWHYICLCSFLFVCTVFISAARAGTAPRVGVRCGAAEPRKVTVIYLYISATVSSGAVPQLVLRCTPFVDGSKPQRSI